MSNYNPHNIIHQHITGGTVLPPDVELGEIVINTETGNESLLFKNNNEEFVKITPLKGEYYTKEEVEEGLEKKANIVHEHNASAITEGTIGIEHIPTGKTNETVAIGNHRHNEIIGSYNQRVSINDNGIIASGYSFTVKTYNSEDDGMNGTLNMHISDEGNPRIEYDGSIEANSGFTVNGKSVSLEGHTHPEMGVTTATTSTAGISKLVTGDLSGITKYFDGEASAAAHTHSQYADKGHEHEYASKNHTHNTNAIVSGKFGISLIPTGETKDTVAVGNHGHDNYLGVTKFEEDDETKCGVNDIVAFEKPVEVSLIRGITNGADEYRTNYVSIKSANYYGNTSLHLSGDSLSVDTSKGSKWSRLLFKLTEADDTGENFKGVLAIDNKEVSLEGHRHDDLYYTEQEIDDNFLKAGDVYELGHDDRGDEIDVFSHKSVEDPVNFTKTIGVSRITSNLTQDTYDPIVIDAVSEGGEQSEIVVDGSSIKLESEGSEPEDSIGSIDVTNESIKLSVTTYPYEDEDGNGVLEITPNSLKFNDKEVSLEGHTHDDIYYTETEVDDLLKGKLNNTSPYVEGEDNTNYNHQYSYIRFNNLEDSSEGEEKIAFIGYDRGYEYSEDKGKIKHNGRLILSNSTDPDSVTSIIINDKLYDDDEFDSTILIKREDSTYVNIDSGNINKYISGGGGTVSGDYAEKDHKHNASDITGGTIDIARIPTGTTSDKVAVGNHRHNISDIDGASFDVSLSEIRGSYDQYVSINDNGVEIYSRNPLIIKNYDDENDTSTIWFAGTGGGKLGGFGFQCPSDIASPYVWIYDPDANESEKQRLITEKDVSSIYRKGVSKLVKDDLNGRDYADGEAAAAAHTHSQYSLTNHIHNEYVKSNGQTRFGENGGCDINFNDNFSLSADEITLNAYNSNSVLTLNKDGLSVNGYHYIKNNGITNVGENEGGINFSGSTTDIYQGADVDVYISDKTDDERVRLYVYGNTLEVNPNNVTVEVGTGKTVFTKDNITINDKNVSLEGHTHNQYLTGYTEQYKGTVTSVSVSGANGLTGSGTVTSSGSVTISGVTATSGATGVSKLVTGDLKNKTYANGEAAAAAHTHSQYLSLSGGTLTGSLTAPSFYETSDERLKTFEGDIDVDFNKLSKLRKSVYYLNNDDLATRQIGMSAQEVVQVYPQLVKTELNDPEQYMSLDYSRLSVVALKAIDKLYEINQKLEDRVKFLEEKLMSLDKN